MFASDQVIKHAACVLAAMKPQTEPDVTLVGFIKN